MRALAWSCSTSASAVLSLIDPMSASRRDSSRSLDCHSSCALREQPLRLGDQLGRSLLRRRQVGDCVDASRTPPARAAWAASRTTDDRPSASAIKRAGLIWCSSPAPSWSTARRADLPSGPLHLLARRLCTAPSRSLACAVHPGGGDLLADQLRLRDAAVEHLAHLLSSLRELRRGLVEPALQQCDLVGDHALIVEPLQVRAAARWVSISRLRSPASLRAIALPLPPITSTIITSTRLSRVIAPSIHLAPRQRQVCAAVVRAKLPPCRRALASPPRYRCPQPFVTRSKTRRAAPIDRCRSSYAARSARPGMHRPRQPESG